MKAPRNSPESGLTFVELLVAMAVGAAVLAAAVIGFTTIANNPMRIGALDIEIDANLHSTLYGASASTVTVGQNPNYFQAAQAQRMKELLLADTAGSSAVFVLGRNARNDVRLDSIGVAAGFDFRAVSSPTDFRDFLVTATSTSVYDPAQTGALTTTNATIFCLGGLQSVSQEENLLFINAFYEIDFVATTAPAGTYVTVRRFAGDSGVPTDYYHLFYQDDANTTLPFRPLAAFFGRSASPSGPALFNIAPNHPFTFVWWPDPLIGFLSGQGGATATSGTVRAQYANMARRTSLFFVLPAFPGQ
jgi:hypothetical protein